MPCSLETLGTEGNLAARGVSEACFRLVLTLVEGFNKSVCLPASFSARSPPLPQHLRRCGSTAAPRPGPRHTVAFTFPPGRLLSTPALISATS